MSPSFLCVVVLFRYLASSVCFLAFLFALFHEHLHFNGFCISLAAIWLVEEAEYAVQGLPSDKRRTYLVHTTAQNIARGRCLFTDCTYYAEIHQTGGIFRHFLVREIPVTANSLRQHRQSSKAPPYRGLSSNFTVHRLPTTKMICTVLDLSGSPVFFLRLGR